MVPGWMLLENPAQWDELWVTASGILSVTAEDTVMLNAKSQLYCIMELSSRLKSNTCLKPNSL